MDNGLFGAIYNPDVLSCLANLSNDEVFTPPEVVNQMLDMLPQELFPTQIQHFWTLPVKQVYSCEKLPSG